MADTIKVHGLKELARKLDALPEKLARKHLQRAVRKGAESPLQLARRLVPKDSHFIEANIEKRAANRGLSKWARGQAVGVLSDEKKSSGLFSVKTENIGVKVRVGTTRQGKPKYRYMHNKAQRRAATNKTGLSGFANSDTYYWRFLEFGTTKMGARPFIRPAHRATIPSQISDVKTSLREGLFSEVKKS